MLRVFIPPQAPEVLVLRRGHVITSDADVAGRLASGRLARLVASGGATATFEGGTAAYPPGALRQLSLVAWVRHHLESQLDASRTVRLIDELAGARLSLRAELAPEPSDDTDRRMLDALTHPRRLDQIASIARAPRFRLFCFIHFLRTVDALVITGVVRDRAVPRHEPKSPMATDPLVNARRMLGVDEDDDILAIKRAYRRIARALHPDLRQSLDVTRRRELEHRLAEVTAAYELLT